MEWIALSGLIFTVGSAIVVVIWTGFVWLSRDIRHQAFVNQQRHESNLTRLTRIETKLNIIGNGSVAHLTGPE